MKKKMVLSIVGLMMFTGASVFAGNKLPSKNNWLCPDRPGCICSSQKTEQVVKHNAKAEKDVCPDHAGCICNK